MLAWLLKLLMVELLKQSAAKVVQRVIKRKPMITSPRFEVALGELLGLEKGFVDHKADTGGATNWGITERVARAHGYEGYMDLLPLEFAAKIYWVDYWEEDHLKLEMVGNIAGQEITSEIFEQGVNTGQKRTAKRVQRVLNILNRTETLYPDLKVDGWLGSNTREALTVLVSQGDMDDLFRWLNIAQGAWYFNILENDPDQDQETFARGWSKRVQVNKGG